MTSAQARSRAAKSLSEMVAAKVAEYVHDSLHEDEDLFVETSDEGRFIDFALWLYHQTEAFVTEIGEPT